MSPGKWKQPWQERFWSKVLKAQDGHWYWTGRLSDQGYGIYGGFKPARRAHRVSYEETVGPIPDGLEIDHLCRVRDCVNPAHLEPVTRAENARRGDGGKYWAAKTHCPQKHEYTKDNTINYRGRRFCLACKRKRGREWARKNRNQGEE